jgi:LPXTG-site transpeptidase (sortase) family protein
MTDNTNNNPILTPSSSPELGRLFKLDHSVDEANRQTLPAPENTPAYEDVDIPIEVMEHHQMEQSSVTRPQLVTGDEAVEAAHQAHQAKVDHPEDSEPALEEEQQEPGEVARRLGRVGKKLAPYLVVFAIGLGLYFFYFNTFSFTSFTNLFKGGTTAVVSNKVDSAALAALQKSEAASYDSWISQFFFDVSDPEIIGMNTDVSGNGLTNFQKYLLNLNPKMYDTLGDSEGDGQKIIDGQNPWTGLALTEAQQKIADSYLDKELISNRIAAARAKHENTAFAPYVSNHSPYYQSGVSNIVNGDRALAETSNNDNGEVAGVAYPTPVQAVTPRSAATSSSTPRPTTTTRRESSPSLSSLGIDTSKAGSINIPSINTTVPLVWSSDPKNFEADLKNGVIHYPGTPLPGEMGTSYVSGHSSGYFWDKSQFKLAFAKLGDVKNGDSFTVTVTLKTGQQAVLHYRVDGRAEYAADDPRQFLQSSDSVVALSTCWPINTTARRLVLYGVLTQVEK